jgi:cellulose synthase/poly-beta-1,6-N-acetylglucosamine synthase-like glycosyltransferase
MEVLGWIIVGSYAVALSFIFLYSLAQLHLVILYRRGRKTKKRPVLGENDWPIVTVQLPVYNEKYVIERLVRQVAAFDYPKDKLEIQILDDSNDETTSIIESLLPELQHRGIDAQLIRREDRGGFKAGALKYGLQKCKGQFVAIFDADFLPEQDFLRKTVPFLVGDPDLGVVQTRWGHLNQDYSILTQLQAFGLDAHFTIEQSGRNKGGHFINFNGTAGVWRKKTILDAGNWQADTLTEDLDLSYRAQLCGWKFHYLEEVNAPAELPATMNALKSQQFRWTKGAAENAIKNLRRVLRKKLPASTKVHSVFHLMNSAIFLCVFFCGILSVPMLWVKSYMMDQLKFVFEVSSLFLLSFLTLGFFYFTSYFSTRKTSTKSVFQFIGTFPLFLSFSMGLSLHNAIAVIEGYIGKKSPFIRTPKFNIKDKTDSWSKNIYQIRKINPLTFFEGLFSIYFLLGVALGIYFEDYGLLAFHLMLALGYGAIFYYSIRHARMG